MSNKVDTLKSLPNIDAARSIFRVNVVQTELPNLYSQLASELSTQIPSKLLVQRYSESTGQSALLTLEGTMSSFVSALNMRQMQDSVSGVSKEIVDAQFQAAIIRTGYLVKAAVATAKGDISSKHLKPFSWDLPPKITEQIAASMNHDLHNKSKLFLEGKYSPVTLEEFSLILASICEKKID